jgi:hypothetical protein
VRFSVLIGIDYVNVLGVSLIESIIFHYNDEGILGYNGFIDRPETGIDRISRSPG